MTTQIDAPHMLHSGGPKSSTDYSRYLQVALTDEIYLRGRLSLIHSQKKLCSVFIFSRLPLRYQWLSPTLCQRHLSELPPESKQNQICLNVVYV